MRILLEFSPEVSVKLREDVKDLADGDFAIFTRRAFALYANIARQSKSAGGFFYSRLPGSPNEIRHNLLTGSATLPDDDLHS